MNTIPTESIEALWQSYRTNVLHNIKDEQYEVLQSFKRVFLAGVMAGFARVGVKLADLHTELRETNI